MLFLDIETQNDWTGGQIFSTKDQMISFVGVVDENDKEYEFWEDDMEKLRELLQKGETIVGYNLHSFDIPIIANYLGQEILDLPQLDLMVAVHKKLGFRPKLDSLLMATFNKGKIGSGADAVKYFAAGELDKLKEYCLEDVRLTKELYEYGLDKGSVKYFDRSGFVKDVEIDWALGMKDAKGEEAETISLF